MVAAQLTGPRPLAEPEMNPLGEVAPQGPGQCGGGAVEPGAATSPGTSGTSLPPL